MSELRRRLLAADAWTVVTERDVSYLRVGSNDEVLVVACDSDGGLGPKPADTVFVDADVLGRFATRVPLLEVVAAGATPVLVVDTLSVERDPTGAAIIAGVRVEAASAGLPASAVTGSTEENVPTVASAVGVTVLARAGLHELRAASAVPPFAVLLLGRPMSAPAQRFGPDHDEVLTVPALVAALAVTGVVEALPIGSQGIWHEFEQLAASAGGTARPSADWPAPMNQSGGPSTAALLAVDGDRADEIAAAVRRVTAKPVWRLGRVASAAVAPTDG